MKSKRVLILDDDRAQLPRLRQCFERFQHGCSYNVVAATSASETLTALTEGPPDLIILEPEMEGFDTLSMLTKLRQHGNAIPVIAASKGTNREAIEAIFRLGLFAYVPKPVDFAPFEHLVAIACESTAGRQMRQKIARDGWTASREEGTAMDDLYSLAGVIDMRARLAGLVRALANERGVRLYPERPVFDFAMSLPAPGVPWKLMLHSPAGRSATVVLSSEHLEDFRAGWRSPVISRIGKALDTLSAS